MEAAKRSIRPAAVAVFSATALLHGLLLFLLPRSLLAKYPVAAAQYLKGELTGERMLDYSPLYLHLHVLAQKLTSHSEAVMLLLHLACSALAACLLFLLLSRFFPRWIALSGVVAFVLDRGLVSHLQVFEPEPLLLLLLLLFACFVTRTDVGSHVAAGICLGLSVWTRPTFLPLLIVVPAYFYFNSAGRRVLISTLAFAFPVLVLLVALWVRSTLALGSFSPFVMNPGTVFYEGNNPNSWGSSSIYPPLVDEIAKLHPEEADYQHAVYRSIARTASARELSLPEVNRYWSGMALRFLEDHPAHALKLVATKLFHAFHAYRWHDVAHAFWNDQWLSAHHVPAFPFSLVSALAVLGLVAGVRRARAFSIFYALIAIQLAVLSVTYVSERQRVATLWVFVLFACVALDVGARSRGRLLATFCCVLPMAILLHRSTDLMQEETRLWLSIRRSNEMLEESYRLRAAGKLTEAAQAAADSLACAPFYLDRRPANLPFESEDRATLALARLEGSDPASWFDRAVLALEAQDADGAEAALQHVLDSDVRLKRDFYQSSEPRYYEARAALLKQDGKRALELLHEAERRSPGDPSTLALLYVLSRDEAQERALIRYFGELDARNYIGRAALWADAPELAVANLEYVSRSLPEYRRGRLYLAAALGRAGRFDEGAGEYRTAMRAGSDPVMLETESIALFAGLSAKRPQEAFTLYSQGIVLRQFGHYREALQVQEQALLLGRAEAIEREIASLRKTLVGALP